MSDTALAIEAAQRLADYAIEHNADVQAVMDDLHLVEAPIRALQAMDHTRDTTADDQEVPC